MGKPKAAGKRFDEVRDSIVPGDYDAIRDWLQSPEGHCAVIEQYFESPNPGEGEPNLCPLPNAMNAAKLVGDDLSASPARLGRSITFSKSGWRQRIEDEFSAAGNLTPEDTAEAAALCERARLDVLIAFLDANEDEAAEQIQTCDLDPQPRDRPLRTD